MQFIQSNTLTAKYRDPKSREHLRGLNEMWLLGTSIFAIRRTETGVPGKPVPSFAKSLSTVLDWTFPGLTECEGKWTNQDPPNGLLCNVEIVVIACNYVSVQHLPTTGRPSLLHIDFASLATPPFCQRHW